MVHTDLLRKVMRAEGIRGFYRGYLACKFTWSSNSSCTRHHTLQPRHRRLCSRFCRSVGGLRTWKRLCAPRPVANRRKSAIGSTTTQSRSCGERNKRWLGRLFCGTTQSCIASLSLSPLIVFYIQRSQQIIRWKYYEYGNNYWIKAAPQMLNSSNGGTGTW